MEKVCRGHMEEVRVLANRKTFLCDLGLLGFPLCTLLICTVKGKEHLQQVLGFLPKARCPAVRSHCAASDLSTLSALFGVSSKIQG